MFLVGSPRSRCPSTQLLVRGTGWIADGQILGPPMALPRGKGTEIKRDLSSFPYKATNPITRALLSGLRLIQPPLKGLSKYHPIRASTYKWGEGTNLQSKVEFLLK